MSTPATSAACTPAASASPITIATRLRMPLPPLSHRLEDARRAHAGADAHGHHAVLLLAPAQAVRDRRRADRARRAQRMAERDGAAQRIDLGGIEAEIVHHRQRLRGEGLVELDPV